MLPGPRPTNDDAVRLLRAARAMLVFAGNENSPVGRAELAEIDEEIARLSAPTPTDRLRAAVASIHRALRAQMDASGRAAPGKKDAAVDPLDRVTTDNSKLSWFDLMLFTAGGCDL